jgi:hypothetical protein
VVRLAYLVEVHAAPSFRLLLGDALAYDRWARAIAGGDWIGRDVFYQAPLYPYVLGTIYTLAGPHPAAVLVIQAVLGAVGCALLGVDAARLVGRRAGIARPSLSRSIRARSSPTA